MLEEEGLADIGAAGGWASTDATLRPDRVDEPWWSAGSAPPAGRSPSRLVGKYVRAATTPTCRVAEALTPRRASITMARRWHIDWVDAEEVTDENVPRAAWRIATACWCPAALATGAWRARSPPCRYARENDDALPGHLPGHADGGDRVCPPRAGPARTPTPASWTPTPPTPSST